MLPDDEPGLLEGVEWQSCFNEGHLFMTSAPFRFSRVRPLVLALPIILAACGKAGAPTNADIQQVVQNYMQNVNERTSDRTLGLIDGPYDPADLNVTNSDCTAHDNDVYHCTVTAVSKKGTHTAQLNLKKVNGSWTLVES